MRHIQRFVICSMAQSIFLLSIEASLFNRPHLEVLRMDPLSPDLLARLRKIEPDLILIEKENHTIAQKLLQAGFPLLLLDSDHSIITTPTGEQIPISAVDDLTQNVRIWADR